MFFFITIHVCTHTLTHTLSHTHTHTHAKNIIFICTHSHSLTHSLTLTLTHTHTQYGDTPVADAKRRGHSKMEALLRQHGGH